MINLHATDELTVAERAMTDACDAIRAKNNDPANAFRMGPTGAKWPRRATWGMVANISADAPIDARIDAYMQTATQYQQLAEEARNSGLNTVAAEYTKNMIIWLDHVSELERQKEGGE